MADGIKGLSFAAVILAALSVLVLISMAITSEFAYTLRTDTNVSITGLTVQDNITNTNVGTTGQYSFLQALSGCVNATGGQAYATTQYTVHEGTEDGGYIRNINNSWNQTTINCTTMRYLAATSGSNAGDTFTAGLAIFATFIGILVMAIIGKVVIGFYRKD